MGRAPSPSRTAPTGARGASSRRRAVRRMLLILFGAALGALARLLVDYFRADPDPQEDG